MNYEGWYQYCDQSEKIRGNNFSHTLFSFLISYCLMPLEGRKEDCMLKQISRPATYKQCTEKGDLVSQTKVIQCGGKPKLLKIRMGTKIIKC